MASNKLEGGKCKGGGDVKAALRHNDCSPEMRKIAAKGNPDIDPEKSYLNVNLTGDTYQERCQKYDARIAALDAVPGANKRRDRVTGQKIETPVPAGLPRDQYNAFLSRVLDVQRAMFGAENLVGADIHWDEEHEYIDPETGLPTMSRVHLQSVFIPVKDGKLHGQAIYSRKSICALNRECAKIAQTEFGVSFHTGKGKSNKDIARLKAESEAAAIKAAAEREAAATRAAAQAEANQIITEARKEREALERWRESQTRKGQELAQERKQLDDRKRALDARETALEAREADLPGKAAREAKIAVKREIEAARAVGRRPEAPRAVEAAQAAILQAVRTADNVEDHSQQHRQSSKTLSPV